MTAENIQTAKAEPTPLHTLANTLSGDMKAVNAIILEKMHSDVPMIPELAGHLIAAGGKRLRPMLTVASAQMAGYEGGERHYNLAACVEFIHTATLLHDDVIDESDQRRGRATANTIFGNEAAVLVGDFLFSRAFQLMVADGSLDVLRILSDASAVISEGEILQMTTSNNIKTTEAQYIQVATSKTAALFAAACEVGGIVAGAAPEVTQALYDYGLNMGIAFQIADDVLDYTADGAKLGKAIGDDFKEGKMTLPLIYAIEQANDEEQAFWSEVITKGQGRDQDTTLLRAMQICEKYGTFDAALSKAKSFRNNAISALDEVPSHPLKSQFLDIADYVIDRSL